MSQSERALVFDMDGVLIDSEPLWWRAEIEVFATVGLELTEADCYKTQGMRMDEAAQWWFDRFPWTGATPVEIAGRVVDRVIEFIQAEGGPMPGVREVLAAAKADEWRIGLASSSAMRLIETVLDGFGMRDVFEVVRSAEHEQRGKPHPDVYLAALRELGLDGVDCIAIEDSVNGMSSALAAGMRCIAVPPPDARADPGFKTATWRFDSLHDLTGALSTIQTERIDS
jgi:mannitol-1-/sugar-/sorbitol-6-/2-deoxyglucose-6-phosphatase